MTAGRAGGYIDEVVQVAHHLDWPENLPAADNTAEAKFWAMQDANYNVLGMVDATGKLSERYEYTPYGERTMYRSAGANDPMAMTPQEFAEHLTAEAHLRRRGIGPHGHQGLVHDPVTRQIENRHRVLHPGVGRFAQRDLHEYVDGANLYSPYRLRPLGSLDPLGQETVQRAVTYRRMAGKNEFDDNGKRRYNFVTLTLTLNNDDCEGPDERGCSCCGEVTRALDVKIHQIPTSKDGVTTRNQIKQSRWGIFENPSGQGWTPLKLHEVTPVEALQDPKPSPNDSATLSVALESVPCSGDEFPEFFTEIWSLGSKPAKPRVDVIDWLTPLPALYDVMFETRVHSCGKISVQGFRAEESNEGVKRNNPLEYVSRSQKNFW